MVDSASLSALNELPVSNLVVLPANENPQPTPNGTGPLFPPGGGNIVGLNADENAYETTDIGDEVDILIDHP